MSGRSSLLVLQSCCAEPGESGMRGALSVVIAAAVRRRFPAACPLCVLGEVQSGVAAAALAGEEGGSLMPPLLALPPFQSRKMSDTQRG